MLQDADPSGEAYVRLPCGGAPHFAWKKEGYWDGAYSYYDQETKTMHTTTKGNKVDIYTINYDSIIWDEDGDMDKIRKRVQLDHGNFSFKKQQNDKDGRIWNYIEKEAEFVRKYDQQFLKEWYENVIYKYYDEEGFIEIRQPIDSKIGQYHHMTAYFIDAPPKKLNQGECGILIRSGHFYPKKMDEYYVWMHDHGNGKDYSL